MEQSNQETALGEVIRLHRKAGNLSQEQLASKSLISQAVISKIENGDIRLNLTHGQNILKILGVDQTSLDKYELLASNARKSEQSTASRVNKIDFAVESEEAKSTISEVSLCLQNMNRQPILLIGGIAVAQYSITRVSKDIDLVCDMEVSNDLIEKLYPMSDWNRTDLNDDGYRPNILVTHRYRQLPAVSFGPKIAQRAAYQFVDWSKFFATAKPFHLKNVAAEFVLVPSAASLAYSKCISACLRDPKNSVKIQQDFRDVNDLINHQSFLINEFYDLIRGSEGAAEFLQNTYSERMKSTDWTAPPNPISGVARALFPFS